MTELSAPYRFVPLAPFVVVPTWGKLVSHDHPFEDGLSGELTIDIKCKTPLCVGGAQIKSSENEVGIVEFFKTLDGECAIPGTSIKGMLRNVLEIATFSRFNQVENQKMGMRDLTNNKYLNDMKTTKSGWLLFEDGKWRIKPCSFTRVYQKEIISHFKIPESRWKTDDAKKTRTRYQLVGSCAPQVYFKLDTITNPKKELALLVDESDAKTGHLVMTGQPGNHFDQSTRNGQDHSKKYEFIFYNTQPHHLDLSSEVKAGFDQIYKDSEEWRYFKSIMGTAKLSSPGIPIFYQEQRGEVSSLGLSLMYRVPYKYNLHDAINYSSIMHLSQDYPDFSDVLFGFINENDNIRNGLKGRVQFNPAFIKSPVHTEISQEMILNGPKPSFYPAYIVQDHTSQFNTLREDKVKLTGWKRYPIKSVNIPEMNAESRKNKNVQVKLETVPIGTEFQQTIRFHNLKRIELGALLWSIDFGQKNAYYHGLGMGKPYGFGAVQLSIAKSQMRLNKPMQIDSEDLIAVCRHEFMVYMDNAVKQLSNHTSWQETPVIKALLTYAKFEAKTSDGMDNGGLEYLNEPKKFMHFKKLQSLDEVKNVFHHQHVLGNTISRKEVKETLKNYTQIDHDTELTAYLASVQIEKETNAKKTALLKEKENLASRRNELTAAEICILELEIDYQEWFDNQNRTKEKNLEKKLRQATLVMQELDNEHIDKLNQIALNCAGIGKVFSKIANQIKNSK